MATRAKRGSKRESTASRRRRRGSEPGSERAAEALRSFWSGSISFGLVNVPVRLVTATRPQRIDRRRLGPDDQPLSREYYCPEDGTALDSDQIIRGYPLPSGEMVPLEDDELDSLEPDKSREIELRRFVPRAELPPLFFERPYFLVPGGEATRAYHLLARVMEDSGRAGIATFVMRGKEHLVAILAERGVLRAELLRFADELRSLDDVGIAADSSAKLDAKLVRALRRDIDALWTDELPRDELDSASQKRLRELVERKAARGKDVVELEEGRAEGADAGDNVVDLMSYLERSLGATTKGDTKPGNGRAAAARKPPRRAAGLDALTKSELYERAQERDIAGRSSMTKAQLVDALSKGS